MPRGLPRAPRKAGTSTAAARQVWVLEAGRPAAVAVIPGLSDGRMTEVTGGGLEPGMAVVTGQERAAR
jgi:HlyD family secretion protein